MKKKLIITMLVLVFVIILIILIMNNNKKMNMLEEDKQELMLLLGIENSSTFLPISVSTVNLGFGDTSECYILKFEMSIEDYNANSLNYKDIDTTETSLNWKEKIDDENYICYVREWEYNEYREDLFNKLKELKTNY